MNLKKHFDTLTVLAKISLAFGRASSEYDLEKGRVYWTLNEVDVIEYTGTKDDESVYAEGPDVTDNDDLKIDTLNDFISTLPKRKFLNHNKHSIDIESITGLSVIFNALPISVSKKKVMWQIDGNPAKIVTYNVNGSVVSNTCFSYIQGLALDRLADLVDLDLVLSEDLG